MASLTHVCMWSDNGWKRITAEQAARLHPGGTVSAHSGLFMCELCGQYVILTDGDIRIRYFKHSAYIFCTCFNMLFCFFLQESVDAYTYFIEA